MAMALLLLSAHFVLQIAARTVRSPTPPMGWNSYNSYSCSPTENKIKASAQSLIDLGLSGLGYTSVTVDCGWPSRYRSSEGKLQWNTTLFPSGGKALGDYIHGLGLDFGLYSGAGYLQCGSTVLPASLGFEGLDAESFAEWGGDSLKYDNCYPTSNTTMVDSTSTEAQSPSRFQHMAAELNAVNRDIQYFVCQWGIGTDVGVWAAEIGNTWRISNDIYNAWRSIWRITNQVVPYYKHTTIGAFADMDIIGLHALSTEEERFHFSMWAINKSPLIIGAALDSASLSKPSLAIMSNAEVIAINQDALAEQAQLVRRHTEEEWDIWLGNLSNSRKVLGVANWKNASQTVQLDLQRLGIKQANARDVWSAQNLGIVSGTQNLSLAGHEMRLWLLSDIVVAAAATPDALASTGYYSAANATLAGSAQLASCSSCPHQTKVGNIGSGARVRFPSVSVQTKGNKVLGIDFINYDYAFTTAWEYGDNTRNMTITVNGGLAKRWAFPLSGGSWNEVGRLTVEVDGFVQGTGNDVVFASFGDAWAPDLVGFDVFE